MTIKQLVSVSTFESSWQIPVLSSFLRDTTWLFLRSKGSIALWQAVQVSWRWLTRSLAMMGRSKTSYKGWFTTTLTNHRSRLDWTESVIARNEKGVGHKWNVNVCCIMRRDNGWLWHILNRRPIGWDSQLCLIRVSSRAIAMVEQYVEKRWQMCLNLESRQSERGLLSSIRCLS